MKTYNKPAASRLSTRFDKELKNILMNDLKAMKAKNHFSGQANRSQLSAA